MTTALTKAERLESMRLVYGPRHPGVLELLTYFSFEHLPPHSPMRAVSRQFADMAGWVVVQIQDDSPELTTALRRLLEAKDCAVRAVLP